jgi:translation initiation factor IF-2
MLMVLLKPSDSFSKLSTEEIQINIIQRCWSNYWNWRYVSFFPDAIIIGFNVRPAGNARQLADKEIDIRYYSIITVRRKCMEGSATFLSL